MASLQLSTGTQPLQMCIRDSAKVVATGCNKLETPFDLLQIGGQVEGLTIDAHYAEVQLRGNAKADLYLSCDQSFIGYSGSPEIRTVLQSEGHPHISACLLYTSRCL